MVGKRNPYMTSNMKVLAKKVLASMTMTASVVSLSGMAMLAPVTAFAAVPADYGLTEGDTISADGNPNEAGYDPDIYIVNDWGYKRLFLNPIIFSFYGHLGGYAQVKKVSATARDAFPTSGLFRNCETNDQRVWGLEVTAEDSGVLHWVNTTGAQAVIDDPNFFRKVFCINNNEFNWYPKGSDYTSVNQVPDYNRGGPGATPTPTPGQGGLNGGAGSLDNAEFVSSLNNEEVGEGENDVAVTGLELEADSGSDLRVLSVRVSLENQDGASSDDLGDYADEVSLWFGGDQVASVDVEDMNSDDDDADGEDEFSQSISLTGDAVVRMSQTEDLRVAVSALENIDSTDLDTNDWDITIEHVRYVDAQGAITTDTDTDDIGAARPFSFVDFSTAADLELEVDEASDNPESRVVDIDDEDTTTDVVLLTADLDATGDLMINGLIIDIATSGASLEMIADNLSLEIDGDVVQTLQTTECSNATVSACNFDDVDMELADGDGVKLRLLAEINADDDITGTNPTLLATLDADDVDVEDENGDELDAGDKTGTALGEEHGFIAEGITVAFVSASESVNTDNDPDLGTFEIKFDVTAFDTDAYVDNTCGYDATPPTPPAVADQGTIFSYTGSGSFASCSLTNGDDETANNNFQVSEGSTEHFTLNVAVNGDDDFIRVFMESVNWASSDLAAADLFYTFNLDEFETDSTFLSAN